jgi:hypothetical protein
MSDVVNLSRKVVAKEGFTFSDGTTIPYGSYIHVPSAAAHLDPGMHLDIVEGLSADL